ncbi:alkaline phosphatase D family protein [Streptomyces sp. NPDC091290]|uniref:alkaline phosphatase D family protein n=1 Tax=Streptomyces sp. NPDC091290 TaxID=3365990 RepID=UPI0038207EB3
MALDCKSVWAGAPTATSVRVVADTAPPTNGSLLVADNEAMTGAVTIGPVTATINGILAFTVTGLAPDTQYWYVVDAGGLNNSYKGTFRTHPGPVGEPLSYIFGAAGDAGLVGAGNDSYITNGVSNNPVFDTMRAQSAAEQWAWFSHLGDIHYRNHNINDPGLFRTAYDDVHNFNLGFNPDARQGKFLRGQAITYVWDDHDFGGNDSNRTVASNPAANLVYRECVPHYPLGSGGSTGIYQSWQVGRVLYVATDSRSFRDPNSDPQGPLKTLLGTAQKQWFENLLLTARDSGAEALVWQSSSRWIGGTDTFSSFEHERDELVQMFGDTGWLHRMLFMTADEHALSICSGPYNPYGRFPMFMFASMDSSYGTDSTAIYDVGQSQGRQRYGTMRVTDSGHTIALTGTGYINGALWKTYTKHVHVGGRHIALSYSGGDVSEPFEPTDDDQKVRNEVTASRVDGGEATYSKTSGPNNVNDPAVDPDGIGVYDEGVQLSVATDDQLPDQASWRVHLGTVDEDRYPSVRIDLARNPQLADEMTGLYLGDRVTVSQPPPWLAPDPIELIAEGGTETIGHPIDWDVVLNASPGTPWKVAQLAAPQTLSRGTYEIGLDGFTGQGGAAIARVAAPGQPPFSGAWALQITPDGVTASGGARGPMTDPGTVIPGENYTAACWAYSPAGWSDLRVVIDYYDAAGGFLSTPLGTGVSVPAGQWTLLLLTSTAPANASRLQVRPRHGGTPSAGAIWYVAKVTAREARATGYSAGPNRPNRCDTSACQLVNAVGAADTELVVHTVQTGIFDRAPWIISAGLADAGNLKPTQFPLDLRLGGETVRASAIKPLAYDSFTRAVAAGSWGTSDGGQAWALAGGTNSERSVDGSRGVVNLPSSPSTLRFQLVPTAVGDCDIRVRMSVDQVATGASIVPGVLLRYTGTGAYYRARIHFGVGGGTFVSVTRDTTQIGGSPALPYTYAANDEFELRVRLIGHRVLMRVWRVGTPEPPRWHHDVEITSNTIAAGQVGTTVSTFAGNTNVSPNVRFDRFEVISPQRITVARSINTVVKAQAAGTAISLAQPAPVPL